LFENEYFKGTSGILQKAKKNVKKLILLYVSGPALNPDSPARAGLSGFKRY